MLQYLPHRPLPHKGAGGGAGDGHHRVLSHIDDAFDADLGSKGWFFHKMRLFFSVSIKLFRFEEILTGRENKKY